MADVFSQYVRLLDDIQQIPVTARESRNLSAEQRAVAVARVIKLVRERVLPQSERDCAGREALFDDPGDAAQAGMADRDAILAPLEKLARVNPADAARVQELLYRLHAAIAAHFREPELMLASRGDDEEPAPWGSRAGGRRFVRREPARPSAWFG